MDMLYKIKLWCGKYDKDVGIIFLAHIPRQDELLLYNNIKYKVIEVLYKIKPNGEAIDWVLLNVDYS